MFSNSNISIILRYKHVPITSIFQDFGIKTLVTYKKSFKCLYPKTNNNYFSLACEFLKKLENDPKYCLHSSICQSSFSKQCNFDKADIDILTNNNLVTVSSVLRYNFDEKKKKLIIIPVLRDQIDLNLLCFPNVYNKLKILVQLLNKDDFSRIKILSLSQHKKYCTPLIKSVHANPSIFSLFFKDIHKREITSPHPSFTTRRRDKIYMVDQETFNMSFNKILSLPIVLYYKAFFFEQFIRTLPSKNKLFKYGFAETDLCLKCNVLATTEHNIFYCKFPTYIANTITKFLDKVFNDSQPEFIFMVEPVFLYNVFFEQFSIIEYIQLTHLILVAKHRCLKIANNEVIAKWNCHNYYTQTILLAQFTVKLLQQTNSATDLIEQYIDFLLQYSDNLTYFDTEFSARIS